MSYLDVGLKLDVEPSVLMRDDVQIKVNLEVSNIVKEVRSTGGTLTYQIGTRNANTVLRLKDGETQVLAGLISDEDRGSRAAFPVSPICRCWDTCSPARATNTPRPRSCC